MFCKVYCQSAFGCVIFFPVVVETRQQLSKIFHFSLRGRQRDMEKSRLINPKTVDRSETRQTHRYMCTRRNTHPRHIFPDIRYTCFTFVPTSVRIISVSYFNYLPFCFSADKSKASFTLLSQHCSLSFTVPPSFSHSAKLLSWQRETNKTAVSFIMTSFVKVHREECTNDKPLKNEGITFPLPALVGKHSRRIITTKDTICDNGRISSFWIWRPKQPFDWTTTNS